MTLHFPSYGTIISYLEQYPMKREDLFPSLNKKKIFETVASSFADQGKNEMRIQTGLTRTLTDLNVTLKLSDMDLMCVHLCLIEALKACANDNNTKIEIKNRINFSSEPWTIKNGRFKKSVGSGNAHLAS